MSTQRSKFNQSDTRDLKALERYVVPYSNSSGDVRFHLVYPNHYWVAMSNLGFQAVYDILARDPAVIVERGFLPDDVGEGSAGPPHGPVSSVCAPQEVAGVVRKSVAGAPPVRGFGSKTSSIGTKWRSFEGNRLLADCHILGFSLSFETDYLHALRILRNQGILFDSWQARQAAADDRNFSVPLIIAGGTAVTLNPEPLADFIDLFVVGEAEELLPEFIERYRGARDLPRHELLRELAQIEGVYVPRFYTPHYSPVGGVVRYDYEQGVPNRPRRRFVRDLSKFKTHSRILTPETEFKSMFLTETGRGCEMGCRFCVAGYIYRPIRKRSAESIAETVQVGLENSDAVGFVGAAVSSHKSIAELAQSVAARGGRASLSSIMSQKVTKALAASISESEYKTVALAPEAGSDRLRRAAGKRVSNEQVVTAARDLAEAGIRGFKLYFIVGLPTESDADVDAIAELARSVRDTVIEISKGSGKLGWVQLSINPFIPKASTPFQWEPMLDPKLLDKKIERVRQLIKKVPNLELRFEPPKESYFQGLLSRGDRRIGKLLYEAEQRGESWKWLVRKTSTTLVEGVPAVDFYVSRRIPFSETLPWEVVDSLIPRTLLEREAMRAHYGEDWSQPIAPVEEERAQEAQRVESDTVGGGVY